MAASPAGTRSNRARRASRAASSNRWSADRKRGLDRHDEERHRHERLAPGPPPAIVNGRWTPTSGRGTGRPGRCGPSANSRATPPTTGGSTIGQRHDGRTHAAARDVRRACTHASGTPSTSARMIAPSDVVMLSRSASRTSGGSTEASGRSRPRRRAASRPTNGSGDEQRDRRAASTRTAAPSARVDQLGGGTRTASARPRPRASRRLDERLRGVLVVRVLPRPQSGRSRPTFWSSGISTPSTFSPAATRRCGTRCRRRGRRIRSCRAATSRRPRWCRRAAPRPVRAPAGRTCRTAPRAGRQADVEVSTWRDRRARSTCPGCRPGPRSPAGCGRTTFGVTSTASASTSFCMFASSADANTSAG